MTNPTRVSQFQLSGVNYEFDESVRLTAKELADAAGISVKSIYRMKTAGLPFCGEFCTLWILRAWQAKNPNWRENLTSNK